MYVWYTGPASGRRTIITDNTPRTTRSPRPKPRESLKTIAFDSDGTHKWALQLQRAGNGNPCLNIVEGAPRDDGTFRKFTLTVWSEDWPKFFAAIDEIRAFIDAENLKTPPGHNWRAKTQKRRNAKSPK